MSCPDIAQVSWVAIYHSPVLVDDLDAELGRIDRVRVPNIEVRRRSGDETWFDELYTTPFRSWRSFRSPASWVLFRESQSEAMPVVQMLLLCIKQSVEKRLILLFQLGIGGAHWRSQF